MQYLSRMAVLCLGLVLSIGAVADADRESLIAAWEERLQSMPSTASFEEVEEGVYRLHDTDLPYEGGLKLVGAMVRSAETAGYDTGFSHMGIVEFTLEDMPSERLSSQSYYFWLSDRQTLHFWADEQRWVDTETYQQSLAFMYEDEAPFGVLSFMLNYGIWMLLVGLIVFAFFSLGRQTKKARALMDQSAGINEQARKNLDRSEALQDEVLAIARESRDLQKDSNDILRRILEKVGD